MYGFLEDRQPRAAPARWFLSLDKMRDFVQLFITGVIAQTAHQLFGHAIDRGIVSYRRNVCQEAMCFQDIDLPPEILVLILVVYKPWL